MKRTPKTAAALAALLLFFATTIAAAQQPVQAKQPPVPETAASPQSESIVVPQKAAPAQQPAAAGQPGAVEQPVQAEKPIPVQAAPVEQVTVVAPELLVGRWDINVDSYLDMQLAMKGKYEHPAKVEYARNVLKANGMNIRIEFQADGCIGVDKTYCGECEAKKGTWCVTCVEGQQMSILVKGHHGWTRRDLELQVCDDLHIRVLAPKEIAGVYERVPDSVTPVEGDAIPPEPPPVGVEVDKGAPKPLKSTKVVPRRVLPAGKASEQKPELGEPSDEIAP